MVNGRAAATFIGRVATLRECAGMCMRECVCTHRCAVYALLRRCGWDARGLRSLVRVGPPLSPAVRGGMVGGEDQRRPAVVVIVVVVLCMALGAIAIGAHRQAVARKYQSTSGVVGVDGGQASFSFFKKCLKTAQIKPLHNLQ